MQFICLEANQAWREHKSDLSDSMIILPKLITRRDDKQSIVTSD